MTVESQPTSSQESIDLNSSDDHLMRYLSQRKNGDPLPSNVIENLDPFTIHPWDADVRNWYLCNIQDSEDAKGSKVRTVEGGYWKQKGNDEKIPLNSQTFGRKVNLQFFRGNEPFGDRTAWMVVVYHSKDQEIQDDKQEFNSLCRIYSGNNDEPCLEEGHNSIDAADIEARLLTINDFEENNSSESATESQVMDKKASLSPTERFSEDWAVQGYDTSNDDYITMKDFVDDISTPSSSESSSRYSEVNPEDPENLLLFLGSEGSISTEQGSFLQDSPVDNSEVPDYGFNPDAMLSYLRGEGNISTEQGSSLQVSPVDNSRTGQLVNEPSLSVPAQSSGIDESVPSQSIRNGSIPPPGMPIVNPYRVRPTSSLSMCIPSSSSSSNNPSWGFRSMFGEGSSKKKRLASRSSDSSGSGSSSDSGSGRSLSGSGSSTDVGKGSGGGSKIKRLGKKYCCLRPF